MTEWITWAACKRRVTIWFGATHAQAIQHMLHDGERKPVLSTELGFLTSSGRFVNRAEAAAIAFKAGQIIEPKALLCSADLGL